MPALLYTVSNTMLYVGFSHTDAAVGQAPHALAVVVFSRQGEGTPKPLSPPSQVIYRSNILWTALFTVTLLRESITSNQWVGLALLALGMLAVQARTPAPA